MYIAGPTSMLDFFQIRYVVPHESSPPQDASPFLAFLPGILDTHRAFRTIACHPRNITELFIDRSKLIAQRMMHGSYDAMPLQVELLPEYLKRTEPPFCVVWSVSEPLAQKAQEAIDKHPFPLLHVTPEPSEHGVSDGEFGSHSLRQLAEEVVTTWERSGTNPEAAHLLREALEQPEETPRRDPVPMPDVEHLLLLPNEIALEAVGFELTKGDRKLLIGMDNERHFEALRQLVDVVNRERISLYEANPHLRGQAPYDTILTAPGILKTWKSTKRRFKHMRPAQRQAMRALVRQMRSRKTFSYVGPGKALEDALRTREGQVALSLHTRELQAYATALSVRGSSNFVPTIRIPPGVNASFKEFEKLAKTARSTGRRRQRKLSRLARMISVALAEGLPDWVIGEVRRGNGVKLLSDAPLEWLSVDGLPLMLRQDVSRITVTPGNLFFGQAVVPHAMVVSKAALDVVLIIRSFREDDRLKGQVPICV